MRETGRGIPEEYTGTERGKKLRDYHESKKEAQEKIVSYLQGIDELVEQYGDEAGEIVLDYYRDKLRGQANQQRMFERAKDLVDYNRLGRELFGLLKERQILEELEDGNIALDIDGLKALEVTNLPYRKQLYNKTGSGYKTDLIYHALKGRKGISKQELSGYKTGEVEARDILYIPQDEQAAFDIEKIKHSKFVISLWDISEKTRYNPKTGHPAMQGKRINFEAVRLAALLYHPKYGDGKRDEEGELEIRDPKTREYRRITQDLALTGYRLRGFGLREGTSVSHDLGDYLRSKAPELLERGLLRLDDFRMLTSGKSASERPMDKEMSMSGSIMINGIIHYVGREFPRGTKIIQVEPGVGGVIQVNKNGEKKLEYVFNILPEGSEPSKGTKQPYAGGDKTRTTPFRPEAFIPRRDGEAAEKYNERTQPLQNFEAMFGFRQDLFARAGIKLEDFPLREQLGFAATAGKSNELEGALIDFAKKYGKDGIRPFVYAEHGLEYGQKILELGQKLKPEMAKELFRLLSQLVFQAETDSVEILADLTSKYPNIQISHEQISEALLARGRDLLNEAYSLLEEGKAEEKIQGLINELGLETGKERVLRSEFMKVANLLNSQDINLGQYEQDQRINMENLSKSAGFPMYVKALETLGRLKPIPEIHWRVDRTMEEYDRRFGMDLEELLIDKSKGKKRRQLLEIGPGSGVSLEERSRRESLDFDEYALSDSIYYPLVGVIRKVIDFEKLEKKLGSEISESDEKLIADFIYKTIVIRKGQTGLDNFQYDQEHIQKISEDVNNLKAILVEIEKQFGSVDVIPDAISDRDQQGNVVYPNKIRTSEQSKIFRKAKRELGSRLIDYLIEGWQTKDLHEFIPVFPPNVMIGDLKDIARLAPNQIDIEIAARSTVYSKGEEYKDYIEFLKNLGERLAPGGIAIDDSIRDNDGWYYRIAELIKAKAQSKEDLEVLVIIGPGFPREDYLTKVNPDSKELVPLSMIITKQGSSRELAERHLLEGHKIVDLPELAGDEEYLRRLDATGLTLQKVRQAKAELSEKGSREEAA